MADNGVADLVKRVLLYFQSEVLAQYRCHADKYLVKEDWLDGRLESRDDSPERPTDAEFIYLRFGFRQLGNGKFAIALFPHELQRASPDEVGKWIAYKLEDRDFPQHWDDRFSAWVSRYVEGSWNVDNGPLRRLQDVITEINAVTEQALRYPLFRFPTNEALRFPAANNTHSYQDAHAELYKFVVDGISKEALKNYGQRLGMQLSIGDKNTIQALKQILPDNVRETVLAPLEVVSEQRRIATHAVRPAAAAYSSSVQFSRDLDEVVRGLSNLRDFLVSSLHVDLNAVLTRCSLIKFMPRIDESRPVQSNFAIRRLSSVVGKRIQRVELGFIEREQSYHDSEAFILHFDDGSSLGISTVVGGLPTDVQSAASVSFGVCYLPPVTGDQNLENESPE